MSKRALALGFGGYADLDLTFGEFFAKNHTLVVRFMPQHPYATFGPLLAENGNGTYAFGVGDYRSGRGGPGRGPKGQNVKGNSMIFVQAGDDKPVVYEVKGFMDQVGGPVGYRKVWQHLAVVRKGNTIRAHLNGKLLQAFNSAELTIPSFGLPSSDTPLRIGRRTSKVSDDSRFWQFYGLIDDVGVFTRALTNDEIAQLAAAHRLHGNEDGLLAGYTFDSGPLPKVLSRKVTLPSAEDIPEYVNKHASPPLPVYHVEVSSNRDSSEDSKKMAIRPSKVQTRPPFAAGEWWKVLQGWENPSESHNGTAAYCWDCFRINGPTFGAKIFAAAAGKVIAVQPGNICVFHAPRERAVYMHIKDDSFAKYFPNATSPPPDGIIPVGSQPSYKARDPILDVGHDPPNADHLHFEGAANIFGQTFSTDTAIAGASVPAAYSNFYRSRDAGKSWEHVSLGIPVEGDVIAYYPWSPWSDKGDPLSVAPAAASWGPSRLDVFARGENDRLWHKRWNGENWDDWFDLGGRLTSAPAAVSWGPDLIDPFVPDRIDVFVRGHDFHLMHKRWRRSTGWEEWVNLGGRLTSSPAAASWGPGRLDVFALGENGHVMHKRWNGEDWDDWFDLGGSPTSAPAAVSWGPDRIDVFVRGHDFELAHKRWRRSTGWEEWVNLDVH